MLPLTPSRNFGHAGNVEGMICICLVAVSLLPAQSPSFKLPPGYVAEKVAGPPQVTRPTMAGFDDRGRLFVAESGGTNARIDELLRTLPDRVLVLDEADGRGLFRRSRVFADKLSFPMGALWHKGALFVASPPSLWRFDEGTDGTASKRTELVAKFGSNGNAADIHGPFLSPDGRLYWADGRHGHDISLSDGRRLQGKAARIFRCKPDGSEVEVVCGGGMDNPVEVAFTPEGEPLFTCNIVQNQPARQDGILFALEGAVYPWNDVYKEFPWTGGFLPMVENLGWVAPSGLMRYRGTQFGTGDVWFSTQFNRNRVMKHRLVREGAGFAMTSEEFLVSEDRNFHPTDVLEDADGSLLVVDTGGWFRIGCPTSKVAQPEIHGSIWRIRPENARRIDDPWGNKIPWKAKPAGDLIELLDDPRWPVRDRAIQALADRGEASLALLAKTLKESRSTERVRNAIWAANRIESSAARKLIREMIQDRDLSVRLAAIHCVGLHRDAQAATKLIELLKHDDLATRRQAATALGRIGDRKASAPLFEAIRTTSDVFLEHALVHALLKLEDAEAWTAFRRDGDPKVRRAALLVAAQTPKAKLTRDDLLEALRFADPKLRADAINLLVQRNETAGLETWVREQFASAGMWNAREREERIDLLAALTALPTIRDRLTEYASITHIPPATRLALLETMERSTLAKWPASWDRALQDSLQSNDEPAIRQTAWILRSRKASNFDDALRSIASNEKLAPETRIAVLTTLAPRLKELQDANFGMLIAQFAPDVPPLQRLVAAETLAASPLSATQRKSLLQVVERAGPWEMPALLSAFAAERDEAVGQRLLEAVTRSKSASALAPATLVKAFAGFSESLKKDAIVFAAKLGPDPTMQKAKLDALSPALIGGDAARGRDLFFRPKAGCSACHALNSVGGGVGPDLGKIGALRSSRDLLEAIVFPSNSFARGFEPIVVETKSGTVHTGVLRRESREAIWIATAERRELRIPRTEIADLAPGKTSIMPQGLDAQLSPAEFRDLMAFLQSLR
jgi:putative membrane-bound dehydrogenase-like protein